MGKASSLMKTKSSKLYDQTQNDPFVDRVTINHLRNML